LKNDSEPKRIPCGGIEPSAKELRSNARNVYIPPPPWGDPPPPPAPISVKLPPPPHGDPPSPPEGVKRGPRVPSPAIAMNPVNLLRALGSSRRRQGLFPSGPKGLSIALKGAAAFGRPRPTAESFMIEIEDFSCFANMWSLEF
jgi:hypothetical protein